MLDNGALLTPPGFTEALGMGSKPAAASPIHRLAWADAQRTDINMVGNPAADPTHSHWLSKLHLNTAPRLLWGRVVDVVPYVNCYKVQVERGLTPIVCSMLSDTGLQPFGTRSYGQLAPGTAVWFIMPADSFSGFIIGVEPEYITNGRAGVSDFISQAGRAGLSVGEAHKAPFAFENNGMLVDWSNGRPFDGTAVGEKGWMSSLGIGVHVDDFMAFLRADEETGIWAFLHDSMLRAGGHNLQVWSACREREDLDDEGETTSIEQYTPYYWEGLGALAYSSSSTTPTEIVLQTQRAGHRATGTPVPPTINELAAAVQEELSLRSAADNSGGTGGFTTGSEQSAQEDVSLIFRDYNPADWQMNPELQGYAAIEPSKDDQQGYYRLRDFYGYLGQAHKRVLTLPPVNLPNVLTYQDYTKFPGVYEESLTLPGGKYIRTAKEFAVVKQITIPTPKQVVRQENPQGDCATNYRAAGTFADGGGEEHKVQDQIPNNTDLDDGLVHALGFLDREAFVFNWQGEHPFHYHHNDWYLPEESELDYVPAIQPPQFEELVDSTHMAAPAPVALHVDERYQDAHYYPNKSYWALLEDGGVVIGDGYGAEIRMSNGNIFIDAPGNINIRAGKNVNIDAGKDFTAKAKHSWDISATLKDGRLKAEHGLYALGGNDGCGGVLIESKAIHPAIDFTGKAGEDVTLGGIELKAPDSMVAVCSDLQIFTSNCCGDNPTPAFIVNMPGGRIRTLSAYFERFLQNAAFDVFVTGSTCDGDLNDGASIEGQGAQSPQGGTEGFVAGATTGAPATVPELLGADAGAGPIVYFSGFDGTGEPIGAGETFGGGLIVAQVNEFWANSTQVNGSLHVNGQIIGTECVYVNGDYCTVYGHFFSPRAAATGGRVTTLKGAALDAVQAATAAVDQRGNTLTDFASNEIDALMQYPLRRVCCEPEFSYRLTPQYKTTEWTTPEPRWQQIARNTGANLQTWTETPVVTNIGLTYPYPGKEPWTIGTTLLQLDTNLFDFETMRSVDRGEKYEDPQYGELNKVTPDGVYMTIL